MSLVCYLACDREAQHGIIGVNRPWGLSFNGQGDVTAGGRVGGHCEGDSSVSAPPSLHKQAGRKGGSEPLVVGGLDNKFSSRAIG